MNFFRKNPPPLQPQFLLSSLVSQKESLGIVSVSAAKPTWKLKKRQDILVKSHGSDLNSSINDILVQTLELACATASVIGISFSSRVTWANLPLNDCTDVADVAAFF